VCVDLERGYARYKATVDDGEGGTATGYGTETQADFGDYCERAETRALGRALAALGIGTQFVGQDLTEGDHVADAPVRPFVGATTNGHAPERDGDIHGTGMPPAQEPPLTTDEINALVELAHSIGVDLQGFGHDMRRVMQLGEDTRITKKLLRASMTRPQYQEAWQAYSTRPRQEVEQSLADEDVPDHAPPAVNGHAPAPDLTPGRASPLGHVVEEIHAGGVVGHHLGRPAPGRLCRRRAGDRGAGRAGSGMSAPTGSTWWCELCQIEVWLAHQAKRQRCRSCRNG
jgi:hypothetical protein